MLVLSRKPQETIVFPHLGITLEILRVEGGKVRVGIEAPPEITVFRGEIASGKSAASPPAAKSSDHRLRNHLHTAGLGLKLLEKQLSAGMFEEAEETLARVLNVFAQLDQEVGRTVGAATAKPNKRALLVEDDTNESELLAGILRLSGYDVQTATDGIEALRLLESDLPDFVLLDMNMPRCDGPSTLAAIRGNPRLRGLSVFAVSGSSRREVGVALGEVGVNRWFQKPLDPEKLLVAMQGIEDAPCVPV